MKKIYFDTEFTGLHSNTTLISIGMVDDEGNEFYGICNDYATVHIDGWLQSNVIDNLRIDTADVYGNMVEVAQGVLDFIGDRKVIMVSDCLAYDWVLFCQLFGGALQLPENIYYIPIDLSTMFSVAGVDPDVSREDFAEFNMRGKHNALHDARVIRECVTVLEQYYGVTIFVPK